MSQAYNFSKLPVLDKIEYEVMHETRHIRLWLAKSERWITTTDLDCHILREGDGIYQTPVLDCALTYAGRYVRLWERASLPIPELHMVGIDWYGKPAWRSPVKEALSLPSPQKSIVSRRKGPRAG